MKLHYPAIFLKEDDGRYTVLFPNIPEAVTCGQNYENAVEMAKECLKLCIKGRIEDHDEITKAHFEKEYGAFDLGTGTSRNGTMESTTRSYSGIGCRYVI